MPKALSFYLSIFCFLAICPSNSAADPTVDHRMYLYKNQNSQEPITVFTPYDQIVLHVIFVNLPKGAYAFQADWYNAMGELQDSSSHAFEKEKRSDYAVESVLEMKKAGILNRLFSASETTGYSVKFYGTWQVRVFLNGNEIAARNFDIR